MAQHVVEAHRISKTYWIPAAGPERYRSLRSDLVTASRRLVGRGDGLGKVELRALEDVSFSVEAGERVGLLGRNGAGKSTLLKILSRVTRPSSGYADVYGHVGALLEVGTGFHPELSGRDNVYLSGSIFGMTRSEVAQRFDEIVEFSGIGDFIDMPVKRYSSGMFARLGFAVATHLKPSVLIVDEVLAVGDLPFQAKCLAHMAHLAEEGTAVLFVTHNLLAVSDFCTRAILLEHGRMTADGPVSSVIADYRRSLAAPRADEPTTGEYVRVTAIRANGVEVSEWAAADANAAFRLDIDLESRARIGNLISNVVVETSDGRPAMHLRSDVSGAVLPLAEGANRLTIEIADLALGPGNYWAWMRFVSLDPSAPTIVDSTRILLEVVGAEGVESIAWPRHRFSVAVGT